MNKKLTKNNYTMNRLLCIISFLMVSLVSMAQMETRSSVSTSQTGGRFEIIQSEVARGFTFKLDKYTGTVFQLVNDDKGVLVWEKVPVLSILNSDENNEITYQLFLGGLTVQDTYLLNIKTGKACILKDNNGSRFFSEMKDYE